MFDPIVARERTGRNLIDPALGAIRARYQVEYSVLVAETYQ